MKKQHFVFSGLVKSNYLVNGLMESANPYACPHL